MLISVAPPLQVLLLLATIKTALGFKVRFEAKYNKDSPLEKHEMECTMDENSHTSVGGHATILFAKIISSTHIVLVPGTRLAFKMPKNGFEEVLLKDYDANEYVRDKKPLLLGHGIAQVHFKGKADCSIRDKTETFDCIALEDFTVTANDHFYQLWQHRIANPAAFYNQVRLVLRQVLETIQEYASIPDGSVHGNIKPENIMLADSDGTGGFKRAALVDLGVADYAGVKRERPGGDERYAHPSLSVRVAPKRTDLFSFAAAMISIACGGHLPWYDPTSQTNKSIGDQNEMKKGCLGCNVKNFITERVPQPKLAQLLWTLYATSFHNNEDIRYDHLLQIGFPKEVQQLTYNVI